MSGLHHDHVLACRALLAPSKCVAKGKQKSKLKEICWPDRHYLNSWQNLLWFVKRLQTAGSSKDSVLCEVIPILCGFTYLAMICLGYMKTGCDALLMLLTESGRWSCKWSGWDGEDADLGVEEAHIGL